MLERLDNYDWEAAFGYAPFDREDVVDIIAAEEGANAEDNWIGVFKLAEGTFGWLSAWCDYTGWDCQAGGESHVCDTLDDLLRGFVGEQDAKRLGLEMP